MSETRNLEHWPKWGPGGSIRCSGALRAPFWVPRGDLEGKGDDSGGSSVGPWRVKKWSGTVFLRSQRVKYTYFQGFEHVNFVNFMWSLEAPGPSCEESGHLQELKSGLWRGPGAVLRKEDTLRRRSREARESENCHLRQCSIPLCAGNLVKIGISVCSENECKNHVFFLS